MPALLAAFVVLLQFGPEGAELAGLGTESAWQYVASGLESAGLWAFMGLVMLMGKQPAQLARRLGLWACAAACWWAAIEGMERAGCRLAFGMHHKPAIPAAQTLCDAALGVPVSGLSVVLALLLAGLLGWMTDARARDAAPR